MRPGISGLANKREKNKNKQGSKLQILAIYVAAAKKKQYFYGGREQNLLK